MSGQAGSSHLHRGRVRAVLVVAAGLSAAYLPAIQPARAAAGDITTVAGNGGFTWSGVQGDGGPATDAPLDYPYGVAYGGGRLLVSETYPYAGDRVRAVDPSGVITTVAGTPVPPMRDGGPARDAVLSSPTSVARDAAGDLYVADSGHHRVRRISAATGAITTVAGSTVCTPASCEGGFSGDGGPATAAELRGPGSIALDGAGNLFVVVFDGYDPDTGQAAYRIRRVDGATGVITTYAGGGSPADGLGDGGPATAARLPGAAGIALDGAGNLYMADSAAQRVRRIDAVTRVITTVAGSAVCTPDGCPGGFSGDGGPALAAELGNPTDVALDGAGNLYIADDGNYRVRRVDAGGIITTFAGTGDYGFSGDGGPATAAPIDQPSRVAVGPDGSVYVTDAGNRRIRRVDPAGVITTVGGDGDSTYNGDNAPATSVHMYPEGLFADGSGVFFADSAAQRARRIDPSGTVTTVAGGGIGDGLPAAQATVSQPKGLATDADGNLYVADCGNRRIRRIDAVTGVISTVAGSDNFARGDGGRATAGALACPTAVALAGSGPDAGALYVADGACPAAVYPQPPPCPLGYRVRRVSPTGTISTVAGTGGAASGGDGGPATAAGLTNPSGVAVDGAGNLFVSDTGNHRVRRVDPSGTITTVVGSGSIAYGLDGVPATASTVVSPAGLTFDGAGRLVIAESGFARIRRVDTAGVIATIAGNGVPGFSGDGGPATSATMLRPSQVAYDPAGNLYLSDAYNLRVRRVEGGAAAPSAVAPRHTGDCGKAIVTNLTLTTDIGPCPADGLVIGKDGITVNLNGHRVIGAGNRTGNAVGIRVTGRTKVKIQGGATPGSVSGFDAGIALIGGSANTVNGVVVQNNLGGHDPFSSVFGDGIVLFFSARNRITNNVVAGNGVFDGIGMLGYGSDDNLVQGNTVEMTTNDGSFGQIGVGIVMNPFLGDDRPRGLSLNGNQVIGNTVRANDNGGVSSLSNKGGIIRANLLEDNGHAGRPGNGIGLRHLAFADPATNETVQDNRILRNGTIGLEVNADGNTITGNTADGSGFFDYLDRTGCATNVWLRNVWGSGGYAPDCVAAGGHPLSPAATRPAASAASGTDPGDPAPRSRYPARP